MLACPNDQRDYDRVLLRAHRTKFRTCIFCSGPSSGGGVMDLERLGGRFGFMEGMGDTGSSSESSIYSTCVSPLLS